MQCPLCNVPLQMTVRKDVEIDYCPQCRGVWLDRGELDKIIERSNAELAPPPVAERPRRDDFGHGQQYERGAYPPAQHDRQQYSQHPKRRKSFLSDLLDFD